MKKSIKFFMGFLLLAISYTLLAAPQAALAAPTPIAGPGPAIMGQGGNLTAFRGDAGSLNNNQWNNMMNNNPGSGAVSADFGNCNALILRCASPKCAGCTSMDLAVPIVNGCVLSNPSCQQYGDALVQTLAAQLVGNANAKMNDAAIQAQAAASQQAAQQTNQQMQMMQQQMAQMQQQMADQSTQSATAVQQALDEQKQLAAQQAQAAADAAAANAVPAGDQKIAAQAAAGVSADIMAREQIGGQILTGLENAEVKLKQLKTVMQTVFDYAGCDSSGNNCTGPKRVATFKDKANQFFDPYNGVLDDIYDAVMLAQTLGVDINDIYMLLSGGCNRWGKYLCRINVGTGTNPATATQSLTYNGTNCPAGISCKDINGNDSCKNSLAENLVSPGRPCKVGDVIPVGYGGCQPLGPIPDGETVQQNWLYPETGKDNNTIVQVGCLSSVLDNTTLFKSRTSNRSNIDIETLQRIISQDAPISVRTDPTVPQSADIPAPVAFCSINDQDFYKLQTMTARRNMNIGSPGICLPLKSLKPRSVSFDIAPLQICTRTSFKAGTDGITGVCTCDDMTIQNALITAATTKAKCNAARLEFLSRMQACNGKWTKTEEEVGNWDNLPSEDIQHYCDCGYQKTSGKPAGAGYDYDGSTGKCTCKAGSLGNWPYCNVDRQDEQQQQNKQEGKTSSLYPKGTEENPIELDEVVVIGKAGGGRNKPV